MLPKCVAVLWCQKVVTCVTVQQLVVTAASSTPSDCAPAKCYPPPPPPPSPRFRPILAPREKIVNCIVYGLDCSLDIVLQP